MRERVEERHRRILEIVREREGLRVTELATALGVSVETARRDVTALAAVGRVRRLHGSVSWPAAPLNARDARLARHRAPSPPLSGLVLGMLVPTADYFYRSIIRGARDAATAAGARLLVGITDYRQDRDARQTRNLIKAGADGLVLTPGWGVYGPAEEEAAAIAELRTPLVLVERRIPLGLAALGLDRVASDHAGGATAAVHHLAGLGHERVAMMSRTTHTWPHIRRGYRAAVEALGLPDDDLSLQQGSRAGHFDDFETCADRLLERVDSGEVRAAVVHTDSDAVNLLQRLLAHGVRVPEEFALVSYNDEIAGLADVPLTAVSPANHAVGESAVTLLLRRIEDPGAQSSTVEWLPRLVVRRSCGAPAKDRTPQA
ncbi:substrate-binding domain-containing protein [Streptomyces sp. NPDC101181]|uniref:LacI family DNA-binding transcriptional regulator n=1 Tax=Streptomyces sp. NPDC101181 TaxID=3366125 RepID=UPI003807828F